MSSDASNRWKTYPLLLKDINFSIFFLNYSSIIISSSLLIFHIYLIFSVLVYGIEKMIFFFFFTQRNRNRNSVSVVVYDNPRIELKEDLRISLHATNEMLNNRRQCRKTIITPEPNIQGF